MATYWPQWLTQPFVSANQPQFAHDVSAYYNPYTRLLYRLFNGTLEVKPPGSFILDSKRKEADDHMRDHFRTLCNSVITPRLHGISAFGTRLAFYEYVSATTRVTPPGIAPDPEYINDMAPAERWTHDLLDLSGAAQILEVVRDVLTMCEDGEQLKLVISVSIELMPIAYALIQASTL
ncbi:uncharacterized protein LACBIDRAFT_314669 [Laccaria bicolor S238N-H82]|uniref:Predicted protein n=1 Tax=Laccaria bicolor (strain S238N-H82 / ATCC MYA-4686) TaxID=486041 RepID=B0DYZ5_LACBS|nr:uncharacterized protein LACBIDRAFT_314669 [Laccaria bicolor S238N-H82]EDR00104.1 predicted protein [Laccaria bicolor S238N-H82]|eukprot:XP_001889161.1 predicted protein [Laccaria bicolor S238N-H82]